MSEHEKREQIGHLAEEVSNLKGQINHISEKLQRTSFAYMRMSNSQGPHTWSFQNGALQIPSSAQSGVQNADLAALLNKAELTEILEHKHKLTTELNEKLERLKGLAPHLFQ